ncbi:unnamed protein product [Moneuplotes crassus]|uniref:Uncharacterized protein n=2 Tax=Euplotes crassus TaxID=5936 RepID=A0AAD1UPE1_EUPCR|nr:unnamed protein product [Moneuplotes crassus]
MEGKPRGKSYKEMIQKQAKNIKKMRESSASLERNRRTEFQSQNVQLGRQIAQNSSTKRSSRQVCDESCDSYDHEDTKNQDLQNVLDSDDEDIKRHREKINRNFNHEEESRQSDYNYEPQKPTRNINKRMMDSSSNDTDEESTPVDTPNDSYYEGSQGSKLDSFVVEIMRLFGKNDNLDQKRYAHVKDILVEVSNHATKSHNSLKKSYKEIKENYDLTERTLKQRENELIQAAKHNKSLNMQIEKLEHHLNGLNQVVQQQSLSKEAFEMLKESNRRIEEDNKYLKELIDNQKRQYEEKEIVWSRELMTLKKLFDTQRGFGSQKSHFSEQEADTQSLQRNSPLLNTPERVNKENNVNQTNTVGRSDYVTLHHPESVSSKHSEVNMSRQAFDNFINGSEIMKNEILK